MEKIVEKSDDPDDVTTFDWGVGVGGEGGGGRTTNFRNEESRLKIEGIKGKKRKEMKGNRRACLNGAAMQV